jgi:hypothetical protein
MRGGNYSKGPKVVFPLWFEHLELSLNQRAQPIVSEYSILAAVCLSAKRATSDVNNRDSSVRRKTDKARPLPSLVNTLAVACTSRLAGYCAWAAVPAHHRTRRAGACPVLDSTA